MTTILVIEDEAIVRENLLEILKVKDFKVLEAENGFQGITLAKQQEPDLIICDLMMPELTGYQVLEKLRQDRDTATIPFIFLTTQSELVSIRQRMVLRAEDYLSKPFTAEDLLTAIANRLERYINDTEDSQIERENAQKLRKQIQKLQKMNDNSEDLLLQLCENFRDPLVNITMAIEMIRLASDDTRRDRYLKILQHECARQKALLNQLAETSIFLKPNSQSILQKLDFSGKNNSIGNSIN